MQKPDTQFAGRYATSVFETLRFAYGKYFSSLLSLTGLGFVRLPPQRPALGSIGLQQPDMPIEGVAPVAGAAAAAFAP